MKPPPVRPPSAPPLVVGGVSVAPGTRARAELPLADLPNGAPLSLPVRIVRGKRPGPTLFVCAAIHGDEVNGVEIVRRVLRHSRLRRLRGALLAVPVVNVFGFISNSRYLPDRRDLNRCFPGSEKGSLASRLAHLFLDQVARKATHGIDLHTGSAQRSNLPQTRVTEDDAVALDLARAFGAPVIMASRLRDGSLRSAVADRGIPLVVYEAGEAGRFDEWAIQAGVRGILRIMTHLEMLPPTKGRKTPPAPILCHGSAWIRAAGSGILRPQLGLGTAVQVGDRLATIGAVDGTDELAVISRKAGIVVGRSNRPFVHEGDALYHVAYPEGDEPEAPDLAGYQVDLQEPFLMDEEP